MIGDSDKRVLLSSLRALEPMRGVGRRVLSTLSFAKVGRVVGVSVFLLASRLRLRIDSAGGRGAKSTTEVCGLVLGTSREGGYVVGRL